MEDEGNHLERCQEEELKGVQFMGDFSTRTLERRASKIPEMLEARKEGKTAFMVMDKLIIYDGPPDPDKKRNGRSRTELSQNDIMAKYYLVTGYVENNFPGNSSYHVNHDIQAASVLLYFISERSLLYILLTQIAFFYL